MGHGASKERLPTANKLTTLQSCTRTCASVRMTLRLLLLIGLDSPPYVMLGGSFQLRFDSQRNQKMTLLKTTPHSVLVKKIPHTCWRWIAFQKKTETFCSMQQRNKLQESCGVLYDTGSSPCPFQQAHTVLPWNPNSLCKKGTL